MRIRPSLIGTSRRKLRLKCRVLSQNDAQYNNTGSQQLNSQSLAPHTVNTISLTTEKNIHFPAPNSKHHDLTSYLAYAERANVDPESTVYVGTHYEYTVKAALERLGFKLMQLGGASDCGVDLLGTWDLPIVPLSMKVIVQCKATAIASRPHVVRELEGSFLGAPTGWRGAGVLGLLVTQHQATKGTREALSRSRSPMAWATCTSDGKLVQMLWNKVAEENGLLGVGVGLRYAGGDNLEKQIHLTWHGVPLIIHN